jgi:hypothetical protein
MGMDLDCRLMPVRTTKKGASGGTIKGENTLTFCSSISAVNNSIRGTCLDLDAGSVLHCKKRLVTSRLGTGKSLTFIYCVCMVGVGPGEPADAAAGPLPLLPARLPLPSTAVSP